MTQAEEQQLRDKINSIIGHDGVDGTYIYCLTRVKEAFYVGTMTLDDFVEVDEEFTDQFVELFKDEAKKLIHENDRLRKAMVQAREILGWGVQKKINTTFSARDILLAALDQPDKGEKLNEIRTKVN